MLPKHKTFLDELGTLLRKYNIESVYSDDGFVKFKSNGTDLCFAIFYRRSNGDWVFENVVSTQDYRPEDLPELESEYSGEENFDD
ncbi:MAG: hypothetical protein J6P89_00220 [Oscillospiraceae bacterium]|nr:hypothetical protein [Oscillospiraceae bacterium]